LSRWPTAAPPRRFHSPGSAKGRWETRNQVLLYGRSLYRSSPLVLPSKGRLPQPIFVAAAKRGREEVPLLPILRSLAATAGVHRAAARSTQTGKVLALRENSGSAERWGPDFPRSPRPPCGTRCSITVEEAKRPAGGSSVDAKQSAGDITPRCQPKPPKLNVRSWHGPEQQDKSGHDRKRRRGAERRRRAAREPQCPGPDTRYKRRDPDTHIIDRECRASYLTG
jgi:hypothetical protein